jgi:hypothetical protein
MLLNESPEEFEKRLIKATKLLGSFTVKTTFSSGIGIACLLFWAS